jgi:hypothetical protein
MELSGFFISNGGPIGGFIKIKRMLPCDFPLPKKKGHQLNTLGFATRKRLLLLLCLVQHI